MLGNVMLLVATLMILHAAFSMYEHLSHLKALGRPEDALPPDLVFEAIAALALATAGAVLRTPTLREVTWRSEMRHRATAEQDTRLSFATFVRRAGILTAAAESRKGQ
ncbi:hypothetical protein B0H21DRAFT_824261 [Amylocystis lapponica]|nr:hypothetical protein B0H21DRAFT_824261 [Amylocystis lapponica]